MNSATNTRGHRTTTALLATLASVICAVMLAACAKKSAAWFTNYDDALSAAQHANKRIILFLSADEQPTSVALKTLFTSQAFIDTFGKDFVLANLDFSKSRFDAARNIRTDSTDDDIQAALDAQDALMRDVKLSMYIGARQNPALYLLTKDGYPITQLVMEDALSSVDEFTAVLDAQTQAAADYEELIAQVAATADLDRARAIDAVYDATPTQSRYMVLPLCRQVPALDPANKTGIVGKHILAIANGLASDAFLSQDVELAAAEFERAAENPLLNTDERQEAYYTAAYLLAQGMSTDYDEMLRLAQLSYDAAPESDYAERIMEFIGKITQQIAMVQQMQEDVKIVTDDGAHDDFDEPLVSAE